MLHNLKSEIMRKGYTAREIGKSIGIAERTMSNKVREKQCFTRNEMYKIHELFFSDYDMCYLFQSDIQRG